MKILASADMKQKLAQQGAEAAPMSPSEFAAFIANEVPKYAKIIKASGAKVD